MSFTQGQLRALRRIEEDTLYAEGYALRNGTPLRSYAGLVGVHPSTLKRLATLLLIEEEPIDYEATRRPWRLTERGRKWLQNFAAAQAGRYTWTPPRK